MTARLPSILAILFVLPLLIGATEPQPTAGPWLELDVGTIGTASEDVLKSAMAQVRDQQLAGLVIRLDTPGGALENTRSMVKDIMAAPYPVIVWVGPAGSRAGSAGAFLTLAAHLAAMAPGTNIGASHPVQAGGEDIPDEMNRKVTNDTVAFIESIAKSRGRNVDMARSFVETSVSITAEEALDNKVVDVVAKDLDTLMTAIDGRTVTLADDATIKLATKGTGLVPFKRSFRQQLLEILSNPNLFYLLFMVGLIGLGYELTHPGVMVPGVVGGICMILAMIATSVLPISYGAAALILVGIGMMIGEAFVASFGILGIGGFVAFVLGSIFLVDPANEAGLRISWYVIAPGAVTVAVAFVALGYLILKAERAPVRSGSSALVGAEATALGDFHDGRGQVRAEGAIWNARASEGLEIKRGDRLSVTSVQGLELEITKPS